MVVVLPWWYAKMMSSVMRVCSPVLAVSGSVTAATDLDGDDDEGGREERARNGSGSIYGTGTMTVSYVFAAS